MRTFTLTTRIDAPPERCFDLSRDIDAHTTSNPASRERAVGSLRSGLLGPDDEVTWEAHYFGARIQMTSKIVAFDRPHSFGDRMIRGPFGAWSHVHRFDADPDRAGGTVMTDEVTYRSPFGPIGWVVDAVFMEGYMRRLMARRNEHLRRLAEGGDAPHASAGAG